MSNGGTHDNQPITMDVGQGRTERRLEEGSTWGFYSIISGNSLKNRISFCFAAFFNVLKMKYASKNEVGMSY